MNPLDGNLSFSDYVAIAKRRAWLVVGVSLLVLLIAVLVINKLPPRYRSTATVSVESQQIPDELVQSTVVGLANEGIGFIQQRVMTSTKLLGVIDKFRLYPEMRNKEPDSKLVAVLRENIFLDTIRDQAARQGGIVAFTLGFEHKDPETAAAVANELVGMFLDENVKTRTARASETTEFLRKEAARLADQVGDTEARVAEFKRAHSDALPEHLELHLSMLQRSENDLNVLDREIIALEQDLRLLETQRSLGVASLSQTLPGERPVVSPAQQLAALKLELVQKEAIYSPAHPDLNWLKRAIAKLEQEMKDDQTLLSSGSGVDPARAQIESEIVSATSRLASLRENKTALQRKIEDLQQRVLTTPQVERDLKGLTRDYENAIAEYDDIRAKQQQAEMAESLETQQKAERFVLLEAPIVPSVPVWPEKKKFYVLGFAAAVGGGGGAAFLAELLDTSIRGPTILMSILQRHPLATIPFIETSADRRRVRLRRLFVILGACFVLIAALVMTHFYFQRLDILIDALLTDGPVAVLRSGGASR